MVNKPHHATAESRRTAERQRIVVPGRVTWRDSRGMTRFASVVTRDVSERGVYLECRGADAIPLYRLVYLQLERGTRELAGLPAQLRDGRVLSAVYRIGPCEPTTGTPSGYALRLLVEPDRRQRVNGQVLHLERVHFYDAAELSMDLPRTHSDELNAGDADDLDAMQSMLV